MGKGLLKDITHNSKVISKKQAAESQLKKNITTLPTLTQAYQNLGSAKDLIDTALPTTADFPGLVATMEAVAGTSNVTLQSVSPANESSSGGTTSTATPATTDTSSSSATPVGYAFSISVKGNYANITSFLSNLQLSLRPVQISGLQLAGTNDALTGTITAQTYYDAPAVLQDMTEAVQ